MYKDLNTVSESEWKFQRKMTSLWFLVVGIVVTGLAIWMLKTG